jgi:predicted Fe-Mo cluster-binding NifX family protein
MKIAFPLLNEKELAKDFVHAQNIGIYDDEDDQTEVIAISEIEKVSTITAFFDLMISTGLKSVVSQHYSYMSLRVFKENKVETLKAFSKNLNENIKLYNENALKQFDVYESLIKDDCLSDCSGCGSTCSSN